MLVIFTQNCPLARSILSLVLLFRPCLRHFGLFRHCSGPLSSPSERGASLAGLGPGSAAAFARQNCAGFTSGAAAAGLFPRRRAGRRNEQYNAPSPSPLSANCGCGGRRRRRRYCTGRRRRRTYDAQNVPLARSLARGVFMWAPPPSVIPRPSALWGTFINDVSQIFGTLGTLPALASTQITKPPLFGYNLANPSRLLWT